MPTRAAEGNAHAHASASARARASIDGPRGDSTDDDHEPTPPPTSSVSSSSNSSSSSSSAAEPPSRPRAGDEWASSRRSGARRGTPTRHRPTETARIASSSPSPQSTSPALPLSPLSSFSVLSSTPSLLIPSASTSAAADSEGEGSVESDGSLLLLEAPSSRGSSTASAPTSAAASPSDDTGGVEGATTTSTMQARPPPDDGDDRDHEDNDHTADPEAGAGDRVWRVLSDSDTAPSTPAYATARTFSTESSQESFVDLAEDHTHIAPNDDAHEDEAVREAEAEENDDEREGEEKETTMALVDHAVVADAPLGDSQPFERINDGDDDVVGLAGDAGPTPADDDVTVEEDNGPDDEDSDDIGADLVVDSAHAKSSPTAPTTVVLSRSSSLVGSRSSSSNDNDDCRSGGDEWIRYQTESGDDYYYNARTQTSQWSRPLGLSPRPPSPPPPSPTSSRPDLAEATHGTPSPTTRWTLAHVLEAIANAVEPAVLQEMLRQDPQLAVAAIDATGQTSLHVAVQVGNARAAAVLLDAGAEVDAPSDLGETPLVQACRANHPGLVRLFLRYGASTDARDVDANSLLHVAIRGWSDDVLLALLEMEHIRGALLDARNADDETPLHLAARHGNATAVRALLSAGATTDAEDSQGRTPLVVSIMENRIECAQLLQAAEALVTGSRAVAQRSDGADAVKVDSTRSSDYTSGYYATPMTLMASSAAGADDSEGLEAALLEMLELSDREGPMAATIYRYIAVTAQELAALRDTNRELERREENARVQIEILMQQQSSTVDELARERQDKDQCRRELEARVLECETLRAACDGLTSRATMLETIARNAQDKLRRERAAHVQQENALAQAIDTSLRENAQLLDSLRSIRHQWHQQSPPQTVPSPLGHQRLAPVATPTSMALQDPTSYDPDAYEDSYDTGSYDPGVVLTYDAPGEPQHADVNEQYAVAPSSPTPTPLPTSMPIDSYNEETTGDPALVPVTEHRPISPTRVDAVWNRFFENMSKAAEERRPMSPVSRRPPPTPTTSSLPPASSVFDAVRKNDVDRLYALVLSGISPNVRDVGEKGTPLHLAAELGDAEAVMLLFEYGADIEIRDENGRTPLLVACAQGHYDCTKFLLQSAANLSAVDGANQDTALHLAAWDGSAECVEILLEYGMDVRTRNAHGLTALANIRARSPLRHRFEDLSSTHPMARTLALLEEAERLVASDESKSTTATTHRNDSTSATTATKTSTIGSEVDRVGWGRWILGSVFGSKQQPVPADNNENDDEDDEGGDDSGDGDETSEADEQVGERVGPLVASRPSPPFRRRPSLDDYEDLRPPPEIEADLRQRRPSVDPRLGVLPPPPPEVVDALARRKTASTSPALAAGPLSPTTAATLRLAPASTTRTAPAAGHKKSPGTTPAHLRTRYVDTFNSP